MPTEEIIAKIVAKAKEFSAALSGDRGVFLKLKEEHAEVTFLLHQVVKTTEQEIELRKRLFEAIRLRLLAHTKGEEKELYPILAQDERTRRIVSDAYEAHKRIERMLDELQALPVSEPAWGERLRALVEETEGHLRAEEHELFPLAREVIGPERAREVEKRYSDAHLRELRLHGT
jgi:hemerythrin superfamily protein